MAKVLKSKWYGFDHEAVDKQFGGELTFVNEFCVNGEYNPVAVYRAANPDTSKGHKKYMLLQMQGKGGLVRGMTEEEMEKWRFQDAVHCLNCDCIVYSTMRHDMAECGCKGGGSVSIDGGKDYVKISFASNSNYTRGTLDLLTDGFVLP